MSNERGFIGELMHRRVPQYLGVYIAAVWLGIEMGDWLSEQFDLPARLTAYIFVFLAVLLPSVAIFAWNHGAPGKDYSPPAERVFIVLNVLLAAAALLVMPQPATTPAPAAQTAVVEESPTVEAKLGTSQRIFGYFWRNRTSEAPDWYGYAVPFMVGEDMGRAWSGFTMRTPFNSDVLEQLRQAGFERGLSEPQALQLQLARERQYKFVLRGEILDGTDTALLMRYTLHDAATGRVLSEGSEPFDDQTFLEAIDKVSATVQAAVLEDVERQPTVADLPMSESMSDSVDAIRLYTAARIADDIERDNAAIVPALEAAVAADPQFAEAHGYLGITYYLQGRGELALETIATALNYEYRLSRETVFTLRINRAAIEGDLAEAAEIARVWTQVEPDNETAFQRFATLNVLGSIDLDAALQALAAVRKINPRALETLKQSAQIEQQRGNLDAARELLNDYVAARPGSVDAAVQLGDITAAAGDLDAAFDAYQKASYLDSRSLSPELGMIGILLQRGDLIQAKDRLSRIQQRELTDQQRAQLFQTTVNLYTLSGQYGEIIAAFDAADPALRRVMPPLIHTIQIRSARAQYEAFISDNVEEQIAELDAIRETLEPPFANLIYTYDAGIYGVYDRQQEFIEAQEKAEIFFSSQANNNNSRLLLFSTRAQSAIYRGDMAAALQDIDLAFEQLRDTVLNLAAKTEVFAIRAELYDLMRRAGKPREAIEGLSNIVGVYPGLTMGHFYLAKAYFDAGDLAAARAALATVQDLWRNADPDLIYVKQANALQAELDASV